MHVGLFLTLLQQPAAPPPAPFPVARVEVTPAAGELRIGQTLKVTARALDAGGTPVATAQFFYFSNDQGHVDSTGVVTAGYAGVVRVTAVAVVPGTHGQAFGFAVFTVPTESATRVAIAPEPGKLVTGTHLTLVGTAYSKHDDVRHDPVSFTSSNPRVATITPDGDLRAVAPGRATITAAAGTATAALPLQVVVNSVTRLALEP